MPTLALPDVAAFFMVLLNYGHKRIEANKAVAKEAVPVAGDPKVAEMKAKLDEVESKISALSLQSGIRNLGKQ